MHAEQSDPWPGLLQTLFWGIGAYALLNFAQRLAAIALTPISASGLAEDRVFAARVLALSFVLAVPLLWILLRAATRTIAHPKAYLGLTAAPPGSYGVALAAAVVCLGISSGFDVLFERAPIHPFTVALYDASSGLWTLLILGSLVLLGPFCEELLFRGWLLAGFMRSGLGPYAASLPVALLFAGAHFQYERSYLLEVFILGLALCALRIRYESLWPPLFLHALNNLLAWLHGWLYGLYASNASA